MHIKCVCGQLFNISRPPNPHEYRLFSDKQMDDLPAQIDNAHLRDTKKPIFVVVVEVVQFEATSSHSVYECPHCGRLLVYHSHKRGGGLALTYLPENRPESTATSLRDLSVEM